MMRYIFILITLLLTGCGAHAVLSYHHQYISTLEYTIESNSKWEIFTPGNTWRAESYKSYLPQYFPDDDRGLISWGSKNYNFFYAKYPVEQNVDLALWVVINGGFQVDKGERVDFVDGSPRVTIWGNTDFCKNNKCSGVDIFTNSIDINFNTHDISLTKGNEKINLDLILRNKGALCKNTVYYPHGTYNLADPRTIALMQTRISTGQKPLKYPCFGFKFSLSCRDIENTVLVISGFSYKGKPIPPLKVRLNYTDLSQVPGYEGPPATQQAQ